MHFGRGHVWCHDAFRWQVRVSERAGGIIRVHHLADAAGRRRSALSSLSLTNFGFTPHGRKKKTNTGRKIIKGSRGEVKNYFIKMVKVRSNEIMDVYLLPDDDNRNFRSLVIKSHIYFIRCSAR